MRRHRLGDLTRDAQHRVQRRHRVLEDHREVVAPHRPDLAFAHREDIAPPEKDLSALIAQLSGRSRMIERAVRLLPDPEFADDAEGLAGKQVEANTVEGAHGAAERGVEFGPKIADFQDRRGVAWRLARVRRASEGRASHERHLQGS